MNEMIAAAYIEDLNKERETTNYLLATFNTIKERVVDLKKMSNPRTLKFWIRLLFDKTLRDAIRAIIEFDYEYVDAQVRNNRGSSLEFLGRIQESEPLKNTKSSRVD